MDSVSHTPPARPPAYTVDDPNAQHQAQTDASLAELMLKPIAALPPGRKKGILERVIRMLNASAPTQADQILLAKPADFSVLYPKLDKLIKDLNFIPKENVGCFAFACGLYSQYCEIKTTTDTVEHRKAAFFQKYFEIEGSDAGISKLQRFKSCDILPYPSDLERLDKVLKNIDVECLRATPVESVNPDFDYPLVFKTVVNKMGAFSKIFALRLEFSSDEIEQLRGVVGKKESQSDYLIVLHAFAQRGKRTDDLLKPLEMESRNDIKVELKRALDNRNAQVPVQCTDSTPQKSKVRQW